MLAWWATKPLCRMRNSLDSLLNQNTSTVFMTGNQKPLGLSCCKISIQAPTKCLPIGQSDFDEPQWEDTVIKLCDKLYDVKEHIDFYVSTKRRHA
jgi:hypothetical protein